MPLIELETTSSTNDEIKKRTAEKDYFTVLAYAQTGGRGQHGRSFISPEGGAYFSVLLHARSGMEKLRNLTPMLAVAVWEAIKDRYGIVCGIKPINDLYFEGKKVCGILCEAKTVGENTDFYLGIGVNLFKAPAGYGELAEIAGYLLDEPVDREEIKRFALLVVEKIKHYVDLGDDSFTETYHRYEYDPAKREFVS